jgi:hypothetical protein
MPTSADERHLRRLLATRAGIVGLYTDDGEASGEANGVAVDFMRDSPREIQRKLTLVGFKRAEQSLEAAAPQAQPAQAPDAATVELPPLPPFSRSDGIDRFYSVATLREYARAAVEQVVAEGEE